MKACYVNDQLLALAELYSQRNRLYGDNYKQFDPLLRALFPQGVDISTPGNAGRFAIVILILMKISRYAQMFAKGGHEDSLDDLSVYAMMLKELDHDAANTATHPANRDRRLA